MMRSDSLQERLHAAGLSLPAPTVPAANYIPFTRLGSLLFVAGQTPVLDGKAQFVGVVGKDVSIETAQLAARLCALNVLAQVGVACDGDFARVRAIRVGGFIRCEPDFTEQALVMNGASDFFVLALGERGCHVRTAVGTNALPRGVPVEIEAIFELI